MFEWPNAPSPRSGEHELADFVELVTWQNGLASAVELTQLLGRLDEVDYSDGVPEEDDVDVRVEVAFEEMERRDEACSGGYPFVVVNRGRAVRFKTCGPHERHAVYKYLLLATRLNMNRNRRQGRLDGTELFEELAAESAKCYLGDRSETLVFGTAVRGGFGAKVENLCLRVGEGDGFERRGAGTPQDGRLDIVAWTPFSDKQPGQLILFGQCKTGTNYKAHLAQLQPDAFCNKWLRSQPVVMPMRTFFVAEALPRARWRDDAVDAGLLFDRCRIVDFSDRAKADVLARVEDWTGKAAQAAKLPAAG